MIVDVAQFGVNHVNYGVFVFFCDVFVYCFGYSTLSECMISTMSYMMVLHT
jgi:hypothetical protein